MIQDFPLELGQNFKCRIISYQELKHIDNRKFYNCSTNFGDMTLVIEQLNQDSQLFKQKIKDENIRPEQFLKKRSMFLSKQPLSHLIPIVYEQYIVTTHKNRSTCLTLIEPIQLLSFEDCRNKIFFQKEKWFILSLYQTEKNQSGFQYLVDYKKIKNILLFKSRISSSILLDFTSLTIKNCKDQSTTKPDQIMSLFQCLQATQIQKAQFIENLNQIIIVKDGLYKIVRQQIVAQKFQNWFEVALSFNFLREKQILTKIYQKNIHGQIIEKLKKIKIEELNSQKNHILQFQDPYTQIVYNKFIFKDGFCMNLLKQISYEDLLKGFFVDHSIYVLKKNIYLTVERPQKQTFDQLRKSLVNEKGDLIFIHQRVSKCECINFLITYFKFVDPILKQIAFQRMQNSLKFQFLGKYKVQRKLKLVFYPGYNLKDEELSMILEKSKLQSAVLSISQMQITDSFLMFLANSQKMKKIKHLDISYCRKITQNGVNSLLISPFCKNLQILNISGAPLIQSSFQSLILKTKLKELYINNCQNFQENKDQVIVLNNIKLIRLEAQGINIQPTFTQNIQYLKINSFIQIDYLKGLKDLPLKQLSIKIVQSKKTVLGGILGNLNWKEINPIKIFAQGRTNKTLKKLDVSGSDIKLKNFKPIFQMPEIQVLVLQNFKSIHQIDFSLSPKILDLSLKNSDFSCKQLIFLLKNTKIMVRVNISETRINKQQLLDFFVHKKILINTLVVSQHLFSSQLIDSNSKASDFIETLQIQANMTLFAHKNQQMLGNMIQKCLKSNKTIKFKQTFGQIPQKCDKTFKKTAIKCINNFIRKQRIYSAKNIYINEEGIDKLITEDKKRKIWQDFSNLDQFIKANPRFSKPKIFYLYKDGMQLQQQNKKVNGLDDKQNCIKTDSISYFTYVFKKVVTEFPEQLLDISLRKNKTIDCMTAIKLIQEYHPSRKVKSIDFRGMVLSDSRWIQQVIQNPFIQSLNNNQYQINLDQNNFVLLSQKYLKFFMKISHIKKFKVYCNKIKEVDILFSVLFHILDYQFQSIEELQCSFQHINMNEENSFSFWAKLSQLSKLKSLKLVFKNCQTQFLKKIFQIHQLNQYNSFESLIIYGINPQSFPIFKTTTKLQNIDLNFGGLQLNQTIVLKILKIIGKNIKSIRLNFSFCQSIFHPSKIFASFAMLQNLQSLIIDLQYTPIKLLSTQDFLQTIYTLKTLTQVQLNLSFTCIPYHQISNIIFNYQYKLPKTHFKIYLIGNDTKQISFDKEGLQIRGIQVIV